MTRWPAGRLRPATARTSSTRNVTEIGIAAVATPAGSKQRTYWALILATPRPERVAGRPVRRWRLRAVNAIAAPPAIELIGIDKRFGPVHANKNINLSVAKGTIHGIVGENGAGKSTLMSILYGFYQPDAGEIRIDGKPIVDPLLRCRDRRRHRHGPPAFHAGRAVHGAGKRHARRRGRRAPEGRHRARRAPSCSGSSANMRWRSTPTRSSASCRSACSSAWKS